MSNRQRSTSFTLKRLIRKFFLSAFVVLSFAAYALNKSINTANANIGMAGQTPAANVSQQALAATPTSTTSPLDSQTGSTQLNGPQPAAPTSAPAAATIVTAGQYKNGIYTGQEVDAFYGLVKVQATIQNGQIANVQFLEYPSDRRTSVRINSFAVPQLQQEAVQAQNANVDIVTGATLTSQAFQMSLQSALDQAKQ